MSQLGQFTAKLTMAAIILGASCVTAGAFQLSQPGADTNPSVAAASFAGNGNGQFNVVGSLSPQEVQHVQWCATRYMSYNATDNSFMAKSGQRQKCRSPSGVTTW
jgi:hypothetical protein